MNVDEWRYAVPTRSGWIAAPGIFLGVLIAALIATGWFFLTTRTGQILDQLALLGVKEFPEHPSGPVSSKVYEIAVWVTGPPLHVISAWFAVLALLTIIGLAVWQRRWFHGIGALVLFTGSNVTTQLIKGVWRQPAHDLYESYGNSWPSGHTTMAAAISMGLLLVVPIRSRGAVAFVGGLFTVLVAWGTMIAGWHRPSDTAAAILLVGLWYLLTETIHRAFAPVPVTRGTRSAVAIRVHDILAGVCAAGGVGILAATALALPDAAVAGVDVALQRLAWMGSFFGIAAISFGTHRVLLAVGPNQV